MKVIYVVGTADTKGVELDYLAAVIAAAGGRPVKVDIGTREPTIAVDVSARAIASLHPEGADAVLSTNDRGTAVARMAEAFARYIRQKDDIGGVIGIGGGGGTSIVTAGMRELPIGLPKLMVSTLASGDVAQFVGVSDIVMMPSITDIAGLNRLSRTILHNAAQAISAMAAHPAPEVEIRPSLGLTMFGVTTPCVTSITQHLDGDYDCLVFHATGTGGQAMEKLVDSGMITGVIDITTTEVCDQLFEGVLAATEDRFGAIARTGVPYVVSVGALDMVNFWAPETMPQKYKDRKIYRHNANVTLMRTTPEENAALGHWIGAKLNKCAGPVRLLLPEKGVSSLDIEGGEFWDPVADKALFDALEDTVQQTGNRQIIRLPYHINQPEFAEAAVAACRDISKH